MKNYKVEVTQSAIEDINDIVSYIAYERNKATALKVKNSIYQRIRLFQNTPNMGTPYKFDEILMKSGFRTFAVKPYIIIHRISHGEKTVYINRIVDGRRDFAFLYEFLIADI